MPPRRSAPRRGRSKTSTEEELMSDESREEEATVAATATVVDGDDADEESSKNASIDGDDLEMIDIEEEEEEEEENEKNQDSQTNGDGEDEEMAFEGLPPRQFYTELPETADLQQFLSALDNFKPVIPDELVAYYLRSTGFDCSDQRVLRLVSLAAQKFITEVCTESMQYCKIRQQSAINRDLKLASSSSGSTRKSGRERPYILTQEDLASSLREYGISIRKPDYYTDDVNFTRGARSSAAGGGGGGGGGSGGGTSTGQPSLGGTGPMVD